MTPPKADEWLLKRIMHDRRGLRVLFPALNPSMKGRYSAKCFLWGQVKPANQFPLPFLSPSTPPLPPLQTLEIHPPSGALPIQRLICCGTRFPSSEGRSGRSPMSALRGSAYSSGWPSGPVGSSCRAEDSAWCWGRANGVWICSLPLM